MRVEDFNFELPQDRIALNAANPRDSARMLHIPVTGDFCSHTVSAFPQFLSPNDLLVVNDTKVIPAQLMGTRPNRDGDGLVTIEVTLHKDLGQGRWKAFVRPAKRARKGDVIDFKSMTATVIERDGPETQLQFDCAGEDFACALEEVGMPPLPPYIARNRDVTTDDQYSYQTVYAAELGSVAAPTAGLHFTDKLLQQIAAKGIGMEHITLHVGAGTFLPVSVDDTHDHKMHSEWGKITPEQAERINMARENGGRIIAVGTTSLRLLESAADKTGKILPFRDETSIFITPGYKFKAVDLLLTNFHLPRSTLFMLVCAFAGTDIMKAAYAHAIAEQYRFYSYGDACLLERADIGTDNG